MYVNVSEHSLEAYLSKVFARTQHRYYEPTSCKILVSKTSRALTFSNDTMGQTVCSL
jgi:hypothetical protein